MPWCRSATASRSTRISPPIALSLRRSLESFNLGAGAGFEEGSVGTTEGTPDNANSFTVDDTEYNIFNTDRRLEAIRTIAQQVASVPQQKALIYFSSGMDRTGIENESELRSATNAAVLANMAIYTMDIRGLQALPPGGAAQNASLRGYLALQRAIHAQRSEFQLHHAGNAGLAFRRYRRPRLS